MKEWVNVMARGGKIILSVIAAALTVASLLLVIIYAFLGVHVISYMAPAEKGGAGGLGVGNYYTGCGYNSVLNLFKLTNIRN